MFRIVRSAVCAAMLAGVLASCATTGGDDLQRRTDAAFDRVAPALVRIHVVEPDYYQGRESKGVGAGSGAIVTPEGHVVTNHHVAGKAVRLSVTLPNREEVPAILVGTDPATDIAVIKLQPETPTVFPTVSFGDSDAVKPGDPVLALGSPRGISQSVTRGIVSNTAMVMPSLYRGLTFELDGENVGELVRWFAHDAEIHPGNSGGPLVDLDGRIVGVNEISFGLGGAIPGNLAKKVSDDIIAHGEVTRAWTGIILQPLLKDSKLERGALVSSVLADSPAERAGIASGDVVLSFAGKPVDVRFFEDLPLANNVMANLAVGQAADVEVLRGAERKTVQLTPEKRQPATMPDGEVVEWGMTARDLSAFTKLSLARETQSGVVVTSTRPGGPIAKAKPAIQEDDVIVSVDGKPVKNMDDLRAATKGILGDDPEGELVPTLVGFERGGQSLLTVARIGIDKLNDPDLEVSKSWLPMETQVLTTDVAEKLGLAGTRGVRVTRVFDDKPEGFPIEAGDVLVAIDGEEIPASEPHDAEVFRTLLRAYRVGTEPELTVLRNGEKKAIKTKLLPSPRSAREMKRVRDLKFEFVVREATYDDRNDPKLEGAKVDVVVDSVTEGGWAALGDLRTGDVLHEINGRSIASLDDVEAAMKAVAEQKPARVVFRIRRGVQDAWLEMEPFW